MSDRVYVPIDPYDWPGTPEYEERLEAIRQRRRALEEDRLSDLE